MDRLRETERKERQTDREINGQIEKHEDIEIRKISTWFSMVDGGTETERKRKGEGGRERERG